MIDLEQIAYDIGVGKSNDLTRWMLPIATLEEMIALIRKQEAALAAPAAPVVTASEPFMYAIMTPEGKPYFDEHCVDDDPKNLYLGLNYLNDSPDKGYKIVALYAVEAPPASELLERARKALAEYVNNSQEHDIGGGDVVVACCESREMAVEALAAIDGMKPAAAPQQHAQAAQAEINDALDRADAVDSLLHGNDAQAALTDEQIVKIWNDSHYSNDPEPTAVDIRFARAILATRQPAP